MVSTAGKDAEIGAPGAAVGVSGSAVLERHSEAFPRTQRGHQHLSYTLTHPHGAEGVLRSPAPGHPRVHQENTLGRCTCGRGSAPADAAKGGAPGF